MSRKTRADPADFRATVTVTCTFGRCLFGAEQNSHLWLSMQRCVAGGLEGIVIGGTRQVQLEMVTGYLSSFGRTVST
jgi:hypothetical protein